MNEGTSIARREPGILSDVLSLPAGHLGPDVPLTSHECATDPAALRGWLDESGLGLSLNLELGLANPPSAGPAGHVMPTALAAAAVPAALPDHEVLVFLLQIGLLPGR